MKKAQTSNDHFVQREKAYKQEQKEAAKENEKLVQQIRTQKEAEEKILEYTKKLQKAYDSMAKKIVKESKAIEHSTKKLENMERKRKELTKSKSPEDTIFARFKRLKGDTDFPSAQAELRKMNERTTGKMSLSHGDLLF